MKVGIISVFVVLCFVGQIAVALSQGKLPPNDAPKLKQEEVRALAQTSAKAVVGEKIDRYVLEEIVFQPKYNRWRVFFEEKGPPYSFDSCFKIFVDDETRKTEFDACP